jgi:inorganic pyrophosphatase
MRSSLAEIETRAGPGLLHVVVEAVRGGTSKFKYDPKRGAFALHSALPKGMSFPYDFGFAPSTLGEDGDPLDVLVLMDAEAFPGCLVEARLIGVIEAMQKEKGRKAMRNDRLIAVEKGAVACGDVVALRDLPPHLLDGIEAFFVDYNRRRGRKFTPRARRGPRTAGKLIDEGRRRFGKSPRAKP